MRYVVGSRRIRPILSRPQTLGDRLARAQVIAPAGTVHAVDEETGSAACGAGVMLYIFRELPWAERLSPDRCRGCRAVVSGGT